MEKEHIEGQIITYRIGIGAGSYTGFGEFIFQTKKYVILRNTETFELKAIEKQRIEHN